MFTMRQATKSDCPLILQFIQLLAKYEKLEHEVTATVSELEATLFDAPEADAKVYLGFEDKEPVGFALFFFNYSTFLGKKGIYLEDLYVKEEYRGRGYGKYMLQFLAKLAVENNYGRLEWSVLDWNQPAIDFYENAGAKAMHDWTIYRLSGNELKRFAGNEQN